jgi:hypothetical protein
VAADNLVTGHPAAAVSGPWRTRPFLFRGSYEFLVSITNDVGFAGGAGVTSRGGREWKDESWSRPRVELTYRISQKRTSHSWLIL